ncbi:Aste57867_22955 [Aphanomyces stellatus]|uniref:HECT-type E3 ubiquitin transferase n=1 Tax=Aphanomyces stellatus TaxID=120398 RepID=A0A485LMG4_9STRA|nr:hypothetical protein As57867_022884 [Aphanomyces stellatus]VFT99605.1 Aste57867_22955 [Aphanomyces stellatus]
MSLISPTREDLWLHDDSHETTGDTRSLLRPASRSFQRMASSFFAKTLLLEDLTPRQRCARLRKQFSRHVPPASGHAVWRTRDPPAAFAFLVSAHDNTSGSLSFAPSPSSSYFRLASPFSLSTRRTSSSSIYCSPVADTDAARSVTGKSIPLATLQTLLSISALPFSLKYAWFLYQGGDLLLPTDGGVLLMKTRRPRVFAEALENLLHLECPNLCKVFRVHFIGESAVDAGAIQREWYFLVAEALLSPTSGLFSLVNRTDNAYFINPKSAVGMMYAVPLIPMPEPMSRNPRLRHSQAFRAAGRFIGRALLDGQMLPLHFCPVLFKLLLGIPVTLDDVESLDKTIYSSLRYVIDNDNAEDLCLTFSATEREGTSVVEVDLIEHGRDIAVTDANKHKYVELMTRWLLFDRVHVQLKEMILGLYEIVPPELLIPFDHKEFELILCGLTEIDVGDWQANTVVSTNLDSSPVLEWFWEIVDAMSVSDRTKLLQYSTGSPRVPVQGFKGLTSYDGLICYFTLKGVDYRHGAYPCIHACYNRIDLPLYPTKQLLDEALKMLLLSDPTGFNIE